MSPGADSAGQPFAGRSFEPHPFEGDTGEADPALHEALTSFAEIRQDSEGDTERAFSRLIDALRGARLLVPLIAEAGDYGLTRFVHRVLRSYGLTESGAVVEKTQELSIVHVEGPDGRAVAPLFSSVETMGRWNPQARPVPVEAARAALATAAEGLGLMVLDPGSPHVVTLRRGALESIATGNPYRSPLSDPDVRAALEEGTKPYGDDVVAVDIKSGDSARTLAGPEVTVALTLVPGLAADALSRMLEGISEAWTNHPVLMTRVDGLAITVMSA